MGPGGPGGPGAGAWFPPPAPPGPPAGAAGVNSVGAFAKALFDISFRTVITPSIIKVLFGLVLVGSALASLVVLFSAIAAIQIGSTFYGLLLLLVSPVAFLVSAIYGRVLLETVMVFFRIGNDVSRIAEKAFEE
ncbi:MAG: DUF4282 domain-containing protein [Acidimicrobiales bacterium]